MLRKVISGGQTGADTGGLMAAWKYGLETGGHCPLDYRTVRGPNPLLEVMGLKPTSGSSYEYRTMLNVKNSDATIILGINVHSAGSKRTRQLCTTHMKPCHIVEWNPKRFNEQLPGIVAEIIEFLNTHNVEVLNVAGNRDLGETIANYTMTRQCLDLVFAELST